MEVAPPVANEGRQAREYWVRMAVRIAEPVLKALSENRLKATMPVEEARRGFSHLEALGRTLAGIAPWLELGADETLEGVERGRLLKQAVRGIGNAVDPAARLPEFFQGCPVPRGRGVSRARAAPRAGAALGCAG